jgi:hypothetical protein
VGQIPTGDTAFFHRKARYYMEWDTPWKDSGGEKDAITWVERFRVAMGPYVEGSYVNVPDRSINDWPSAYYGDNFARLRRSSASTTQRTSSTLSRAFPQEARVMGKEQQGATHRRLYGSNRSRKPEGKENPR